MTGMTKKDTKRQGLSENFAQQRLLTEGYNELPQAKKRGFLRIAFEVVKEPMFILLIVCGGLYLALGDLQEALMLLGFVFVIMAITFYQERKTERAIEALRDLSSPRAMVIRDGQIKRIPGREVVREDLIIVSEGDRVPADAVILETEHLSVDESLLTGESVAVGKTLWDGKLKQAPPGGDDLPFIFSGTLIVQGQSTAKVTATGAATNLGKIGKALGSVETENTPLQRETGRVVRNFAALGFAVCTLVVVGYGITRGNWLEGFLAGIALAMALLPEEFPVVLTIFLALGAWRISRRHVLTRRVPAIETLGSATVLCVDKTGTLTQNLMTVRALFAKGVRTDVREGADLPDDFHEVVEFGALASRPEPFDPMEKALVGLRDTALKGTDHVHGTWKMVHEYPLSRELLAMSQVWGSPDGADYVIASKGAPEAIADLCHLTEVQKKEFLGHIHKMAGEGLRLLGVAKAHFKKSELPKNQHDFRFELVGLVGFMDPIRPEVPKAVRDCYRAGIRVVMITGDYPGTAQSIAKEIGLKNPEKIITGPEITAMSKDELRKKVKGTNIFSRVVPEQKLHIVEALKANGEIVAMTGDGVNDAPALKSAHIGIAMGMRGTDVARESAALVLLNDAFHSIVDAVRLGRRIYDNIRKAMCYIISVHIPIAGISLVPILFGWPMILLPIHIVFLELLIDPACSVAFEAGKEEKNVMRRPPRGADARLFDKRTVALSVVQGSAVLILLIIVMALGNRFGTGEDDARALTYSCLIVANIGLIVSNLSWSRSLVSNLRSGNKALWGVIAGALLLLFATLYIPFMRELFRFNSPHPIDLVITAVVGLVGLLIFEATKAVFMKWK
jgi:P-type Ca2+ transporter type 2C